MDSVRRKYDYARRRIDDKTVPPYNSIKVFNASLKRSLFRKRFRKMVNALMDLLLGKENE